MSLQTRLDVGRVPTFDFFGRLEHIRRAIEEYLKDVAQIPEAINFSAALILARMAANPEDKVRETDLRRRGYYFGSNVSYNIRSLIKLGYLASSRSREDKRTVSLSLTEKGTTLGLRVAMHLNFVEEQIGDLFSQQAHKQAVDFLCFTVFNSESSPGTSKVPKEKEAA